MDIARMCEQAGSPPKQFDPGPLLLLFEHCDHGVEILIRVGEVFALRSNVPIVKCVKGGAQLFNELESSADPVLRILNRFGPIVPGANGCSNTERIGESIAEGVPVNHRK